MEIIQLQLSVTNCYLIKTETKYVLVDTGYQHEWDLFCKKLKGVGVDFSEISHLVLTHHHDDHSGLLQKVLDKNNDILIVASVHARELLLKGVNDRTHGGGFLNKRVKLFIDLISLIMKKPALEFPPFTLREKDFLLSGEIYLTEIGIKLNGKIIATPGHSTDSISILLDDGNCIIGDAAANFFHILGTKYCPPFICNVDEYYDTWRKLIAVDAIKLFPGHGNPFGPEKLKQNIGKIKKEHIRLVS